MRLEYLDTKAGRLSRCYIEAGEPIADLAGFLELLGNCRADTIVLDKEALSPAFFELRSGLAGELLQKISTYRRRLVILGDFAELESRALRDFIYESNRTGTVVFAPALPEALALLR